MPQRSIRFPEATEAKVQAAVRARGFESPTAFIRYAVDQELSGRRDNLAGVEERLAGTIEQMRRELFRLGRGQQALFAYVDSLAKVFLTCNRMEIFADALSYMAGYGLKAYLITQDIRQIVDAYGNNESIVSNCHVRIAFAPNQFETADLLSKMTGTTTVSKASYNYSGSRFAPVMAHVNASVDHIERPLMTPDEVLRLKPSQKAGAGISERIVAPGQMLIFVSGHHPILGTQMLYFLDPVLSERASVPPPTKLMTLEDGELAPQKPSDRTRNVISKPEIEDPSDGQSHALGGFLEELQLTNKEQEHAEKPH
jgi:Arc/MetJ-type ribon-helix-helix transcriptional regulator